MASAERRRAEGTLESLGSAGCDEQQRNSQRRPRRCHSLMPTWARHRPSFERLLWSPSRGAHLRSETSR